MTPPGHSGGAAPPGRRRLALPPGFAAVALFNLTLSIAWLATVPVVPLIALAMGAGPVWIGLTVGASAALPILLALPAGWVASRVTVRLLQTIAGLAMAAGAGCIWAAETVLLVMLGQALIGLSATVSSIAAHAFIAVSTPGRDRDALYGRYSFLIAFSNILGPAIGGGLAGWAGARAGAAAAFTLAACSLPQLARLPNQRLTLVASQTGLAESARAVLRVPMVLLSVAASFVIAVGASLKGSFYVLYLDRMGFSTEAIGVLLAISGAAMLGIRPMLGLAAAWAGHATLLAAVCITMGVGIGLVPVFREATAGQVGVALLTGLAYGISQPLTMTMVGHAAAREALGLAFAWRQIALRAAELAGPVAMGLLAAAWRLEAVFPAAALALVIPGGLALRMARVDARRDSAAAGKA